MNITELAMLKKIAGKGGNGGTVDGLVIKTITFTDRPSAWEFIKKNYDKILRLVLSASVAPVPIVYETVTPHYTNDGEVDGVSFGYTYMTNVYNTSGFLLGFGYLEISDDHINAIIGTRNVELNDASYPTVSGTTPETIPDEYWQALSAQVTVYYMGEAESGGEEDNIPSCLVVVGNYSTDPFEVTVKMLVENNEVVDHTAEAVGYGEYAEFPDTQKGSVATLKTTLPVIVRDGYNHDIIYSNSEYVEVDEANQMTYVTIPMDSAVVEIAVALAE